MGHAELWFLSNEGCGKVIYHKAKAARRQMDRTLGSVAGTDRVGWPQAHIADPANADDDGTRLPPAGSDHTLC